MSCIFCDIVSGKLPAEKLFEDNHVLVIKDINAAAPVHILAIPKKHIPSFLDLEAKDAIILSAVVSALQEMSRKFGLDKIGFRIVNNVLQGGGQTVFHIHFHLLGGRTLGWPPG